MQLQEVQQIVVGHGQAVAGLGFPVAAPAASRGSIASSISATFACCARICPTRQGDLDGLRDLLAADVQMVGDSGGKAP
jgi:hypothetical protein